MKSSEVSIKTRSTPASLTIQGQVTKDTTVKWSIDGRNNLCQIMGFEWSESKLMHIQSKIEF